jgi:hypothetical protein
MFPHSGSSEMIDNYWTKMGGKPVKGQSKRGAQTTTGSKRRRAEDSPSNSGAGPSKRGRRSAVPAITDQEEDPEADDLSAFARDHKDSMAPYADHKSWEDQIKSIETIERGANDKLVVYMVM